VIQLPGQAAFTCGIRSKVNAILEVDCEPEEIASRRSDGVTGERNAEVDDIKSVCQVLPVHLQANVHAL